MTRIAILGAGNGGCAAAADLSMRGHSVALYDLPQFAQHLEPIEKRGGLEIIDEGFAQIDTVTSDVAEAMRGAEWVFNPVPAFAHEIFARTCAPYVEEDQTIVIWGKGGACLIYGKVFRDMGVTARVAIGDTNTLPYGATKMEPTLVRIEAPVICWTGWLLHSEQLSRAIRSARQRACSRRSWLTIMPSPTRRR
jgi:opine dehydrogenase